MLLTNQGKILTSVDTLYLYIGSICETPYLLPKKSIFWNDLARFITTHAVFKKKLIDLKYKAALFGELEVISHDETFKTLFSLIGQDKMTQKMGELHAVHTFRGFTGCTLGVSAQRSTSHRCFEEAVKDSFNDLLPRLSLFSQTLHYVSVRLPKDCLYHLLLWVRTLFIYLSDLNIVLGRKEIYLLHVCAAVA